MADDVSCIIARQIDTINDTPFDGRKKLRLHENHIPKIDTDHAQFEELKRCDAHINYVNMTVTFYRTVQLCLPL